MKFSRFGIFAAFLTMSAPHQASAVDLSDEQVAPQKQAALAPAEKQWFDRFDLSGNFAVGSYYSRYVHHSTPDFTLGTGGNDGHIYTDGMLNIDALVANDLSVHLQWFVTGGLGAQYFNRDSTKPISLGEAYLLWKNFLNAPLLGELSLKAGTFDLPFGEEYLSQYPADNPLIQNSAAWPWGQDQGLLLYGKVKEVGWILSVTDGSLSTTGDEHPSKAFNAKLYAKPLSALYLSASYMKSGTYNTPALWLGNNALPRKVAGAGGIKGFDAGEIDVNITPMENLEVAANFGVFQLADGATPGFDRTLHWWMIQPKFWVSNKTFLVSRYSIFASNLAYAKMFADPAINSNTSPGLPFQAQMKQRERISLGLGYKANTNTTVKLELARDKFDVAGGVLDPSRDNMNFVGAEVAVKF